MHEFNLNKSADDMDEDELRSTISEFMDKHTENVEDYNAVAAERDEFSETVEELDDDLEIAQSYFADKASDYTNLDADVIVDRFSLAETIEMAGDAEATEFSDDEGDDDVADEDVADEPTFDNKPERAPADPGDKSEFSDQAESDVKAILGDY